MQSIMVTYVHGFRVSVYAKVCGVLYVALSSSADSLCALAINRRAQTSHLFGDLAIALTVSSVAVKCSFTR